MRPFVSCWIMHFYVFNLLVKTEPLVAEVEKKSSEEKRQPLPGEEHTMFEAPQWIFGSLESFFFF